MNEPNEDDERLAALLEGRVKGGERERMLSHLAAADDDYEVFVATAAMLRALEEQDAPARPRPQVRSMMRRGGWRAPRLRAVVVVTGTVVLLLGLRWALGGHGPSMAREPFQLAMRADPDARGMPAGWRLPTPLGTVRGRGGNAGGDAVAVKAGAMLVELSVAVRARDTAQTRTLARRLSGQLEPGARGTPLQHIAERPDAPTDSLAGWVAQATERLADRRDPLELGAWLEAARLAANGQNSAFFEDGAGAGMLERAERLVRGDPVTLATVGEIRAALGPGSAPRWNVLEAALGRLLAASSG